MTENWKAVDADPKIEISDLGNVRRTDGKPIAVDREPQGYLRINIKGGRIRVQRLVAKAFCPNPEGKPIVDHKNDIKDDNRAENLQWSTWQENTMKAYRNGKLPKPGAPTPIVAENIKTGEIRFFPSQGDAAKCLGIHNASINKQLRGKRKTVHGYRFHYAHDYAEGGMTCN